MHLFMNRSFLKPIRYVSWTNIIRNVAIKLYTAQFKLFQRILISYLEKNQNFASLFICKFIAELFCGKVFLFEHKLSFHNSKVHSFKCCLEQTPFPSLIKYKNCQIYVISLSVQPITYFAYVSFDYHNYLMSCTCTMHFSYLK